MYLVWTGTRWKWTGRKWRGGSGRDGVGRAEVNGAESWQHHQLFCEYFIVQIGI